MEICEEGYINLRCAIIEQASKDYLNCRKLVHVFGLNRQREIEMEEIMRFFHSLWYQELMPKLDASYILKKLDVEFEDWTKDRSLINDFKKLHRRTKKKRRIA